MLIHITAVIASYFIGAFPHLYFLCKLRKIETTGDRHINLWQKAGPLWGLVAIAGDVFKGIIVICLGKAMGLDLSTIVICGLVAVSGQMWPVFSKFDGEKGNTTGLGMALALTLPATMAALVPVLFGLISKLVRLLRIKDQPLSNRFKSGAGKSNALPVGVALGLLILPVASYLLGEPTELVFGFVGLFVIVMIRRLTQGLAWDIKNRHKANLYRVIYNRFLYDRR
jgi:acyl phosphate:glycerol-3-phosphate acyltransferase